MSGGVATVLYRAIRFVKDHLMLKLALAATILLSTAYLLLVPIQSLLYQLLDYYYYDCGNLERIEADYRAELQKFITEQHIISADIDALYTWNLDNPEVSLCLSDDTYVYYILYSDTDSSSLVEYNNSYIVKELKSSSLALSYATFYPYNCVDGNPMMISLSYYGYSQFYLAAYYLSLIICLLIFLVPMLLLIRSKTGYIRQVSEDVHVLEGGDLLHHVTEKGSDELYYLSHSINQMRLSILDRQAQIAENEKANRQLVTSLSHDLRTPLTSIIGYLEIMKQHKYKDSEQLDAFIEKTQEKAFVMKEISDKLFEYFLVSQKASEEYHMEVFSIPSLLSSLLDNQVFDLTNHGFTVETPFDVNSFRGSCRMDVEFMQRVLDNILSNICKYADPSVPVRITASETEFRFSLRFENGLSDSRIYAESTGIGLKTCQRILDEHHGELKTERSAERFATVLLIPITR